ncbi:MAG: ArsR/SmtB family transcription factor [Thermoanaerobaculia bacterium]
MAVSDNRRPLEIIRDNRRAVSLLRGSRQEILRHLAEPDSAAGLSRRLGVPRQRLNYHLRQLEKDGLVELVEERRRGNCVERVLRTTAHAVMISPEGPGGEGGGAGIDRASAAFQIVTAARVLREVAELDGAARAAGERLVTLTLDTRIRFSSVRDRSAFARELADALAELLRRFHEPDGDPALDFRISAFLHPTPPTREALGSES